MSTETLTLNSQEILQAVILWMQQNRVDLCRRYNRVSGTFIPVTVRLEEEIRTPQVRPPPASEKKEEKEEKKEKEEEEGRKRLIRVDLCDGKGS